MPRARSENPTQSAIYQRQRHERMKLIEKYKKAFPSKAELMMKELYPESSERMSRTGIAKWEPIMKEDLNGPTIDFSEPTPDLIPEIEYPPAIEEKPIKLFNPNSVEPDPRKMDFDQLTEYVTQLGIDKWDKIPEEFLYHDSVLANNRIYAYNRWRAHKEFLRISREQQQFKEFQAKLNEARLTKILEEARERAKSESQNYLFFDKDGNPGIHFISGLVITKDDIVNSDKCISGYHTFEEGKLYAFYSDERNFLTALKVRKCYRDDDEESDRLVIKGIDYRGFYKTFFYRMDSSLALEIG